MSDIFLSYASADRERVRPLVDALEASGWSVWWDRKIPAGRTYAEILEAALRAARCILVVWTKTSVESDWVREEAERGKRRRLLVPVRLDDVAPPLGFGQIQAADLIGWDGARTAPGFEQLVGDVAGILGTPREAAAERAPAERPAAAQLSPRGHRVPASPASRTYGGVVGMIVGIVSAVIVLTLDGFRQYNIVAAVAAIVSGPIVGIFAHVRRGAISGAVTGLLVGAIAGFVRGGALSRGRVDEALGEGLVGLIVGLIGGAVIGAAANKVSR